MTVRKKLLLLIIPALLGLILFSYIVISNSYQSSQDAFLVEKLVQLSGIKSRLVHELQKERGLTAGFVGSKSASFGDALRQQRDSTDAKYAEFQSYIESDTSTKQFKDIWDALQSIDKHLQQLSAIRLRVDKLQITLKEALAYYTKNNNDILNVNGLIIHHSQEPKVTVGLSAFYEFLQGKERAGIERAVLNVAFANKNFPDGMLAKFIALVSQQDAFFNNFKAYASEEQVSFYQEAMNHSSVRNVEKFRQKALKGDLNQNAQEWFNEATQRINILKSVDTFIAESILQHSRYIQHEKGQLFWMSLIVSVVIISLVILVGLILLKGLEKQVKSLVQTIEKASQQDLTVRAEKVAEDELGTIAESLNDMMSHFSDAVHTIFQSSEQLAAAAEQTSTTVSINAETLEYQQAEVMQVATAIEEMSASIQEVSGNVSRTSDAANAADKLASESNYLVIESVNAIEGVSSKIKEVSNTISQLHESSNSISTVIEVIKSIAEQTNLLALNAAIEAARAGEQGRGFAVVADEVRSLAQRTQESTQEIEDIVTSFQNDSTTAFNQMNSSREQADTSVQLASKVQVALNEIVISISEIKDMSIQISAAAEEQVAVSQEISNNSLSIGDSAQSAAAGGQQISSAAQEQAELATSLQTLASKFKVY